MNQQAIIQSILRGYLISGQSYPQPLPEVLQSWYCYTCDGGHSIVCAVKQMYQPGVGPEAFLVPVPVKTVLRGYAEQDGYIIVDLPYDKQVGLITPQGDDEF